ncbi:hypothetical protein [Undibacterium sp. Xuan67W]|uniref:hypothetical protein n=1 Tax=Undibacterium sp. Xuan67W TaxID=3413057 RepID=UPI003BF1519F
MTPLFKKLNWKNQAEIVILNAPASFESELTALTAAENVTDLKILRSVKEASGIHFALAFVITQKELDELSAAIAAKAQGDAIIWFVYPKKSSKRYQCEFHRDTGWDIIRTLGYDSVRMVAIDDDWSALRFRKIEFIKA